MYIFKNAFRNIRRAPGKSILIGIIVFIIGFSACISLSIRQAAINAKKEGEDALNITANLVYDRAAMMGKIEPGSEGEEIDKDAMREAFTFESLTLSEMQKYAKADSVKDFYYEDTIGLNGNDALEAISSEDTSSEEHGGKTFMMGPGGGTDSDFSFTGYSSYDAMKSFADGEKEISAGEMFDLDSTNEVVISEELATFNSLKVGDSITFVNPNNEAETFELKIKGLYKSNDSQSMMSPIDPANQIYTSNKVVSSIVDASSKNQTNIDNSTAITNMVYGTYVFENVASYNKFEKEAQQLGLSEDYTAMSADINAYEQSLLPLNNLASFATTFLIVVLAIGGSVLIVFNILRIKERTYEIGVLSAVGMNKLKVSLQFIVELFMLTFISITIAIILGAFTSVPITNALLESQDTTSQMQQGPGGAMGGTSITMFNGNGSSNEVREVNQAMDYKVIMELLGVAIVLTILSGGVSLISVLRYNPLQILSERN